MRSAHDSWCSSDPAVGDLEILHPHSSIPSSPLLFLDSRSGEGDLTNHFATAFEIFALNQLHVNVDVMEHWLAMSAMSHSVLLEVLEI